MLLKILLAFLLLGSINGYADINRTVENVVTVDSLARPYSTITVASTTTNYSKSVSLVNHSFESVGVMYKATSSGVINLTLQAERSFDRPSTESAANTAYISWNAPATVTDSSWHMVTLDTVVMPYLRFKLTGVGSNDASTSMQIKVEKQ